MLIVFPILNEIILNFIAIFQSDGMKELVEIKLKDETIFPLVYSPGYNITACGLEKLHPFDSTKYKRTWQFLHRKGSMNGLASQTYW